MMEKINLSPLIVVIYPDKEETPAIEPVFAFTFPFTCSSINRERNVPPTRRSGIPPTGKEFSNSGNQFFPGFYRGIM